MLAEVNRNVEDGIQIREASINAQAALHNALRLSTAATEDRLRAEQNIASLQRELANDNLTEDARAAIVGRIQELTDLVAQIPAIHVEAAQAAIDALRPDQV